MNDTELPAKSQELRERVCNFATARYIKLGESGNLAEKCISEGSLYIGYFTRSGPIFDLLLANSKAAWNEIRSLITRLGQNPGSTTAAINQVRSVVEDEGNVLWFTFFKRQLYWTFIDASIPIAPWNDHGGLARATLGWRCTSLEGGSLPTYAVTSRIAQVQAYRRTVRSYRNEDDVAGFNPVRYLRGMVSGEAQVQTKYALEASTALAAAVKPLIQLLTESEFENFVDMILVSDGWQRVSEVGKQQEMIDGEYWHATSGIKIAVQVKSRTSWSQVKPALEQFAGTEYDWVYWIYHSAHDDVVAKARDALGEPQGDDRLPWFEFDEDRNRRFYLLGIEQLARLTVDKGFVRWLANKAR